MLNSSNKRWYFDLMMVLLHKELTVRYKGSALGFFWSVLHPLALALVYYFVFGVYMRFNEPHYLVALLSALFPWQCFCNCVNEGAHTFVSNPTLVKKVAFPRQAIPLVMNLQHTIHLIISLPIFTCFAIADGIYPSWIWVWGVPLLLIILLTTVYGLCLLFGSINLFLKDIGNLVIIGTNVLFFATPVIYMLHKVPTEYLWCFKANPVAPLFICWRSLLLENHINWEYLPYAGIYAVVFLACGTLIFHKLQYRFAEVM